MIRDQYGITPTHEIERLPVEYHLAGRVFPIAPPTMRQANAWLLQLERSAQAAEIKSIIAGIQEVHTLKSGGSEDAANRKLLSLAEVMRECGGEMLDLAYDFMGLDKENRVFIERNTDEAETIRLFLICYFLGNRLRTPAVQIAAAVSESPSDSAANDKSDGETKSGPPRQNSTSRSSKSARHSTPSRSKTPTPPT